MQLHPYICFEGRAEEAIKYYCETLGAEVTALMRGSEAPPDACGDFLSGGSRTCISELAHSKELDDE